jgi:hypothetical protein
MESTISLFKGILRVSTLTLRPHADISVLAREERDTMQTSPNLQEERGGAATEELAGTTQTGYDQGFIRWIPIVVPLFAVLLMLAVYLIDAAVLRG